MKPGFVYIITNKYQTVVYVGVTSNLPQRIIEHKNKKHPTSFSARYDVSILVYYEQFQWIEDANSSRKTNKSGFKSCQKQIDSIYQSPMERFI